MKLSSIKHHGSCELRVSYDLSNKIIGDGEATLLIKPLLGLITLREFPGNVLLKMLECVPQWVKGGRVVVSGFHSPLQQQVLRSLFLSNVLALKVFARCFSANC